MTMGATLLIMAAGMGSRYGGNKQVDGLGPNGEILMEYSIYDAIRAGFDHVVFVIKPGMKDMLASICYLLNLGHGIGTVDDIDHLGSRRLR